MLLADATYSNPSKVLQRNEHLFEGKKLLVAGEITDSYPKHLQSIALESTFCFSNFAHFKALENQLDSSEVCFTDAYTGDGTFNTLLIYLPKSKIETLYLLANLTPYLEEASSIILVGEKKTGIKSADKLLRDYSSRVNAIDSARHCSVLFAQLNKPVAEFSQKEWIKEYDVFINEVQLKICSLPGVFSHGTLDKGSQLLLENLPETLKGDALDFGCGAGVLGCYLLKHYPKLAVDLIDVSAYAVKSAALSLQANNLKGNVFPSDSFSETTRNYDLLISNPPFHAGQKTDYSVTESFLTNAPKQMKIDGLLSIVANKFLKYEPILEDIFPKVLCVQETNKFKILNCTKASPKRVPYNKKFNKA